METDLFPPVPLELLEELERRFPNRVPNITDSDRQVWVKVGQSAVVSFLRAQFEEQSQNLLEAKVTPDVYR